MQVVDCFLGRCEKPTCDGCGLRLVRLLRRARKSMVMASAADEPVADGAAARPVPSATGSSAAPLRSGRPPVPSGKHRKRLLVPREEIAWFPTIRPELCNGCGDCKVLCKPGVFEPGPPDPTGIHRPKLVVANPYKCLVLCTRCVPICTSGAIVMPPKEDFERFVEYLDA